VHVSPQNSQVIVFGLFTLLYAKALQSATHSDTDSNNFRLVGVIRFLEGNLRR
jgi:hypothetical protein